MPKGYHHVTQEQRSDIPVRHESAPLLTAESADGKARPSAFRI